MKYPLVAPLAAFSSGIVAAQYAAFSFRESSISILLLLALALTGLLAGAPRAGAAACLAGLALAGALWTCFPTPSDPLLITAVVERERLDLRDPVRLRGWVREPAQVRRDQQQFVLAVESLGEGIPARGGVRVTLARETGHPAPGLTYGERVEFLARLRRPRNFENPGGFDRVNYLLRQDIQMTAALRAGVPVAPLPGRRGNRFQAALWRARHWAGGRADQLWGAGSTGAALVKAMVLGDAGYLDRALGVSFQRTGTYHVLVVSGSQVAVLAWFFLWTFRRLRASEGCAALLAAALVACYVLLVGSQLPTLRAAAMVAAYLIARHFYRQRRALNILAGTALMMLIVDPQDLFDVSFQLSFLSVALIAALAAPILDQTLERYRLAVVDLPNTDRDIHLPPQVAQTRIEWRMASERLPFSPRLSMLLLCRSVAVLVGAGELFVLSAAVQIGLLLPMAVYFHRISWSGLSANLFVVPLMSLLVPVGFLAIATGWGVLAKALSGLATAIVAVVEWHARLSWLEARVPGPAFWFGCLFAASLVGLAWALGRGRMVKLAAALVLAAGVAGLALHPFPPQLAAGRLELTALDVGQGEALFLVLPEGQTLLVDGGGLAGFGSGAAPRIDIGEEVVSPYLWSRSVRALDAVVVSHAHYDHIGGLPALLENFRVRELWIGNNPRSPDYDRVLETAERRGTRVLRLAAGDARSLGGVKFDVLAPPADYVAGTKASNDDSLVLVARFAERRFLLTGDIERKTERRLIDHNLVPRVDFLKVPHHGSKTSTNDFFLAAAKPWTVLISAGDDNPYGHPHPDVLDRLARLNAQILRTDRHGQVRVSSDGRRLWVTTYRWEKQKSKPAWGE